MVDFKDFTANNDGVFQVATANVEYPRPLAYCGDPIICCSCLLVPYLVRVVLTGLRARHCATPQGDRYTGVRDRNSPLERPGDSLKGLVGRSVSSLLGWSSLQMPVPVFVQRLPYKIDLSGLPARDTRS